MHDPPPSRRRAEALGLPYEGRLRGLPAERTHSSLAELRRDLDANPRDTLHYPGEDEDRATSLFATLDLSYRALPADAALTLPLLALFPAGLMRDAARAILGKPGKAALEILLLYGMAEWRDDAGYSRFVLPEPARRYAQALQAAGTLDRYAPAALAFLHELVMSADAMIAGGKMQAGRLLLTLEQPNLRQFLDWGYDHELRDDGVCLSARSKPRGATTTAWAKPTCVRRLATCSSSARTWTRRWRVTRRRSRRRSSRAARR